MSVVASNRSECKLEAALKALDLCTHTLNLTKGKKFLPEYQSVITDKINELAVSIYINVRTANDIVANTAKDLEDRVALQRKAAEECNLLRYSISIAKKIFHLRSKSVENWIKMTIGTRDIIKSWSDSDKKRFNEKIKSREKG